MLTLAIVFAVYFLGGLVMVAVHYRDQPMPGFLVAIALLWPIVLPLMFVAMIKPWVIWIYRSLFDRGAPYIALPGMQSFNVPPKNCEQPTYDLVSWLRRSGHIPENAEIYTGSLRDSRRLADAYFYLPQHLAQRPWWTYIAALLGSRICIIFYSHNFKASFGPDSAYPPIYKGVRWPEAIVLTPECEIDFKLAGAKIGKFTVDPRITVMDSGERPEFPREVLVAVCDIDPDPSRPHLYHSKEVVLRFLEETSAAIVAAGAVPVWKPKGALRPEDALGPKDLRADAHEYLAIARKYGAIICTPRTPLMWVVKNTDCGIVLPFTSAAHAFKTEGQEVCYYDPTGKLDDEWFRARGTPIITKRSRLNHWIHTSLTYIPPGLPKTNQENITYIRG